MTCNISLTKPKKENCTNPMIFGNLISGGFGILMCDMSQLQTILSFQGCDKIVLRLHTAGTEKPDTPKHIRAPSISMNTIQIPPDTHHTSTRHPPDISREQEMPTDNNRCHQTQTDSPKHPKKFDRSFSRKHLFLTPLCEHLWYAWLDLTC